MQDLNKFIDVCKQDYEEMLSGEFERSLNFDLEYEEIKEQAFTFFQAHEKRLLRFANDGCLRWKAKGFIHLEEFFSIAEAKKYFNQQKLDSTKLKLSNQGQDSDFFGKRIMYLPLISKINSIPMDKKDLSMIHSHDPTRHFLVRYDIMERQNHGIGRYQFLMFGREDLRDEQNLKEDKKKKSEKKVERSSLHENIRKLLKKKKLRKTANVVHFIHVRLGKMDKIKLLTLAQRLSSGDGWAVKDKEMDDLIWKELHRESGNCKVCAKDTKLACKKCGTFYCSLEHMKQDWDKEHKEMCSDWSMLVDKLKAKALMNK
jgi:hypothetical protein